MTLLVGWTPDDRADALTLGLRLARVWSDDLVLCSVQAGGAGTVRAGSPPPPPADLPADVPVTTTAVQDRSVPGGLVRAARAHGASTVVLGDGPLRPGTVASRLARAAELPVAIAGPTGEDGPITRVTCAYGGSRDAEGVLATAHAWAQRCDAGLRIASFAGRRAPTFPSDVGLDAGDEVVDGWREQILDGQRRAMARLEPSAQVETCAVVEPEVADAVVAIGWHAGDLLVVEIPATRTATRALAGPTAAALRAAPVPALVVPGAPAGTS